MNEKFFKISLSFVLVLCVSASLWAAFQSPELQRNRELVRNVQQALAGKGFDPGPIDGIMGPRTREAIRGFQSANGLTEDGQMNDATLSKLGVEIPASTAEDKKDKGLVGTVAEGGEKVGETVASGATTAAKATAKGATVAAEATAKGATVAAEATAKGATTGAKATAKGATVAAEKTVEGAEVAAGATVKGVEKAGEATVGGVKTARDATKEFLFGKDADDKLRDEVRKALKEDEQIQNAKVDVSVKDGVVTLSFKEGNRAVWNRAVSSAKKVEGVKDVVLKTP